MSHEGRAISESRGEMERVPVLGAQEGFLERRMCSREEILCTKNAKLKKL